ncbi:CAAX amino protease [Reticulibacter mediterranei]|uniref:CAAX amino protease n=1 Tax=Reticulibacter mediterranei TaxID=2778369 RepID=A0A8J3J2L1_9CHLR|nr:type II CAAX endopeptidase family protein [Reticulibacter mediterranei]GHO99621.1 CAAX amino protease [Reticulibacter mediterranei]
MTFFRRLFSFSLIQLIIELLFLAIIAGLISFFASALQIPSSIVPTIEESMLLVGVAVTFLLARFWIERRPFADLGLSTHRLGRYLLIGFVVGAILQGTVIGNLAQVGWYHVTSIAPVSVAVVVILQGLGIHLMVALVEEGIFRGIIFRLLERTLGTWVALLLSAILFGMMHLTNPGATVFGALAIALEGGIMLGAAYVLTRNLWLAVGIHWAWNFFEGPFFGTSVSGIGAGKTFITSTVSGPAILTGGTFGPEAGVLALITCLVAGAILLTLAVRRKQVLMPSWLKRAKHSADLPTQPVPSSLEGK